MRKFLMPKSSIHKPYMRNACCLVLSLLFVVLSGCATSNISSDFSLNSAQGKGIVFGSLTVDKINGADNAVALFHIESETGESHYFKSRTEIIPDVILVDSEFTDVNGRIFSVALNDGKYKLRYWQLKHGTVFIRPAEEVEPLEFEVKGGKVSYLGNWHMNIAVGPYLFLKAVGSAHPEIRNQYQRDLTAFIEEYPQFKAVPVDDAVPRIGLWGKESLERHLVTPSPVVFY